MRQDFKKTERSYEFIPYNTLMLPHIKENIVFNEKEKYHFNISYGIYTKLKEFQHYSLKFQFNKTC